MAKVLILSHSGGGHIETLAYAVAGAGTRGGHARRYKLDQPAPVAQAGTFVARDAVIVGAGMRRGRTTSWMANLWDQAGGLWAQGKVGAAFASTASQHGRQETTLVAIHAMLFRHGRVQVGLSCSVRGQLRLDEVAGGAPFLGRHVAGIAAKRTA